MGKTPESHDLFQKFRGGRTEKVGPDERVSFKAPGVERFVTIPKDPTEGRGDVAQLRREFVLSETDQSFLDGLGVPWESVKDGRKCWVLIHEYPIPPGYTTTTATVALLIPDSYPTTQIDMAHFHPHLARADGVGLAKVSSHVFDAKNWQQWSRHRTGANPWRPDVDNIETHVLSVRGWLERELTR